MINLQTFIRCLLGPRLFAFYKLTGHTLSSTTPDVLSRSHRYVSSPLESASDYVIRVAKIVSSFGAYLSPVIFTYLVYKGSLSSSSIGSMDHSFMLKLFGAASTILFVSYCTRGFARYSNRDYLTFLTAIENASSVPNVGNKRILAHFDADFSAYPVDFQWTQARDQRSPCPYEKSFPTEIAKPALIIDNFPVKFPLELLMSLVMKTIGRRLIYPGSLSFLQNLMQPAISTGRAKLIEEYGGMRYKLQSYDNNSIDSMFVDRRGATPNGDYLVIGCEGNGGFYELGTILTPLESGYSVLGWNHPGFGGSTGIPSPNSEVAAIDTVVKFAMDKLSFAPSQIVVYGWSIGGFTATWAGMRHPNIHGMVVDASFDHILPLAARIFPSFIYPLVELGVRQHFDLDNSRHLEHYQGPVLFIRRSQDEVISLDPFNSPPTNRANNLLINMLKQRFPNLVDDRAQALLREYLGGNARYQDAVLKRYAVNNTNSLKLLLEYFHTHKTAYPVNIGPDLDNTTREQLVLFLASKHLIDYDSVHCAPLPPRYFHRPWNLIGVAINSSSL